MLAVRYDRFGGIDELYLDQIAEPTPDAGQVLVRVESAALNPGALPFLHGAPFAPNRDLAGTVSAVGADVSDVEVGDEVLGRVQSWDAHAEQVLIPADQLVRKPAHLSWDVAGSLYTTPMAGVGAFKAVAAGTGDLVVISGASGGVGSIAAQYAVRAGARVIGLTSDRNAPFLRDFGVETVRYGDGEETRIRAAADGQPITAFIDAVGDYYIDLALNLDVAPERIDTVVNYAGAKEKGVKALGTRDAGGLAALTELAELAADKALVIPIGSTHPLTQVQDAYTALRDRPVHGRVVLHPQDHLR